MRFLSKSSCCLYGFPPHCSQSPVCLKCVWRKRKLLIDSLEWTLTWITFLLIESFFSRYACGHNPNNARFFSGGLRCCECAFHLTAHNLQCFCSQKRKLVLFSEWTLTSITLLLIECVSFSICKYTIIIILRFFSGFFSDDLAPSSCWEFNVEQRELLYCNFFKSYSTGEMYPLLQGL